ncbi:MAG: hydroxymyristoyl-ACP dehydratase [Treponema sp.]|nr:hydroxymyristoyl-ACP dehydratase [Treponema sp.]
MLETCNVPPETVVFRDEDSVSVHIFVPRDCAFFDGHFPEFKLMPAVGQFGIVVALAGKYFGLPKSVSRIKRMKFSLPVFPDTMLRIDMECDRNKMEVSFLIADAHDGEKVYSSGKFA